jgi:hypothetical protein
MEVLRAVLPDRYSPLQANGNGIQSIYLTELSQDFAEVLGGFIGEEVRLLIAGADAGAVLEDRRIVTGDDLDVWESKFQRPVTSSDTRWRLSIDVSLVLPNLKLCSARSFVHLFRSVGSSNSEYKPVQFGI